MDTLSVIPAIAYCQIMSDAGTVCGMRLNHAALRVIRQRTGLSQAELADLAGIDRGNLAHIEAGRRRGTEAQIKSLAGALQVTVDALQGPELS